MARLGSEAVGRYDASHVFGDVPSLDAGGDGRGPRLGDGPGHGLGDGPGDAPGHGLGDGRGPRLGDGPGPGLGPRHGDEHELGPGLGPRHGDEHELGHGHGHGDRHTSETIDPEGVSTPHRPSLWTAIHPRLVALIRTHRSTMIFVNSRRLAERLAAALNDLAGEPICRAHHGSLAKDARAEIEDQLKRGVLPAIVSTSSLELGIDIGAVDLVIQVEAPPSVASGIQRIGRAGHQVGATSHGRIFPKFRGDLLACAAVVRHVREGHVEATYYARNPLDVLAQQLVALMVERGRVSVDEAYQLVRGAAPFVELPRRSFEGVLDLLSGRYPSERFGELRPRVTYDRLAGTLTPRKGARMLAIANAGTIPDRGLYGVFLAGQDKPIRVGELDEEMVFESQPGEVFRLGASSWRIEEITHDRVLVSPAPGEPGKMPFWRGDGLGRPLDFGRAVGELARDLARRSDRDATATLVAHHGLDALAAENLVRYLREQAEASEVPTDRRIVIERFRDELGDHVVALLSPFGAPVHAPWSQAVQALLARDRGLDVDVLCSDDGVVFRFPDVDDPPDDTFFLPDPDEVEALVTARVGQTSLFAARFRENAARALLLPRRRPGQRTPLFVQRRKSAQLLQVASEIPDFPILLETYREVLRDVFDLSGLVSILRDVRARKIRVRSVETRQPSPFAAALLFHFVASFLYEGDAPLAERRAQALTLDHTQLRALLGEPELRELLDVDAVREVERALLRLDRPLACEDDVHDRLLALGDRSRAELAGASERGRGEEGALGAAAELAKASERGRDEEGALGVAAELAEASEPDGAALGPDALRARAERGGGVGRDAALGPDALRARTERGGGVGRDAALDGALDRWIASLLDARRIVEVRIAGEPRLLAVEDVARYRDALGVVPPRGLPQTLLEPARDPLGELVGRYARTHGPFVAEACAARLGLGVAPVREALERLVDAGRLTKGELLPLALVRERGHVGAVEYCDVEVLRRIKRRSLAKLRAEVEAVDVAAYQRFVLAWHGVGSARRGVDALAQVIEQLQGVPIPASDLEARVLPARLASFDPRDLDELCASGEVVWRGLQPLGEKDGRVALYLSDHYPLLAPIAREREEGCELDAALRAILAGRGAVFFRDLVAETGRMPAEVADALWDLVWCGEVTNDTLAPLRSRRAPTQRGARPARRFTGRGVVGPPGTEGRWSRLPAASTDTTARLEALSTQLLERHGVLLREGVHAELQAMGVPGGFSAVYPVLRAMEDVGKVRRGHFVDGLGAAQFALPGCEDRLRAHRDDARAEPARVLAADDPANVWGAALGWPRAEAGEPPKRQAGARVVLFEGRLVASLARGGRRVTTFLPDSEPERGRALRALAEALGRGEGLPRGRRGGAGVELTHLDGEPASASRLAPALLDAGFVRAGETLFRRLAAG
ncbi:MAG: DEAD/DEAH box helicase [Myxococcales bacterium]|nr:DEAD/DEAH box helicase [Myxococcales bacterium]